uniref:C-type lectin domain-containing protein n=1 Tax=Daphnia galeata TaxID=27404 RepID=A0A8J2RN99_9CRUS|nr:unnamed protein product [Daphnia galeata]
MAGHGITPAQEVERLLGEEFKSTGAALNPGYANWADGEPNDKGSEDCLGTDWLTNGRPGWNDFTCGNGYDAICEAHP